MGIYSMGPTANTIEYSLAQMNVHVRRDTSKFHELFLISAVISRIRYNKCNVNFKMLIIEN